MAMQMKRTLLVTLAMLALGGCTAVVSDLNGFNNDADACDPRGTPHIGQDLDIQFVNTMAHVNQDMRFAIEVGPDHSVEALAVVSAFDNPNELLHFPEMIPGPDPATLAFWADSNMMPGFQMLPDMGTTDLPDHQWFRPICPNGQMTFTHTTPFQDIHHATSTGAIFRFHIPAEIQRQPLFDHFRMAAWAVRIQDNGARQTRAYYQWQPLVALSPGMPTPTQRPVPMFFQVGGNVIAESRGAIDSGEIYEVHFVIDADSDGDFGTTGDYNCVWMNQAMPSMPAEAGVWDFDQPLTGNCDPNGFDPVTFM
jgi:hypothetical protein